jgi:molybdopterin-binding protein
MVHGMVSSEVTVELAGGIEIVSVITKTSAENLALAKGKEVTIVIKASNVIIAVD